MTWNSCIFIKSIENSGGRFVPIYTEISRHIFINCYKVNNLVVICEKLNFQKSSVHKLGKKPENPIFGVLELNI